jgi:hypothetical protein
LLYWLKSLARFQQNLGQRSFGRLAKGVAFASSVALRGDFSRILSQRSFRRLAKSVVLASSVTSAPNFIGIEH